MTNVMTTPPSPPCYRCGQPILEAHYPDGLCPRPRRRASLKAVTVTRAIGAVILIVMAALMFMRVAAGSSPSHHQQPRKSHSPVLRTTY
jgi:hypothetical protein